MQLPLWIQATLLLVAVIYYIVRTAPLLKVRFTVGRNDNDRAIEHFIKLVGDAQDTMVVCDDGNKMKGSIYENDQVIETVQIKLKANPHFTMRCVFSSPDKTKYREAFGGEDRVQIRNGPRRNVHYKIIDDGASGYLSRHPLGGEDRSYRLYETVPRGLRQVIFGRHLNHMESVFAHAA